MHPLSCMLKEMYPDQLSKERFTEASIKRSLLMEIQTHLIRRQQERTACLQRQVGAGLARIYLVELV